MQTLESAFQKVVENAEANCHRCVVESGGRGPHLLSVGMAHTCDATIDLAAEAMLAAALAGWNSNCDSAFAELNAEINRLRAHEALIKEIKRGDWPPKEE